MTPLDLDLVPEPPASPSVMAARQRRALVVGLGGGRASDAPMAKSSFAERRLRATDTVSTRYVDPLQGVVGPASPGDGRGDAGVSVPLVAADPASTGPVCLAAQKSSKSAASFETADSATISAVAATSAKPRAAPASFASMAPQAAAACVAAPSTSPTGLRLDDALVVPAGASMRGYLRCHALLLVGDVVGNVHCTVGPVVIRSGASLKGRLVATGDVYVCGTVGDSGGGAVITTRGKLTLAPGARVDGDVRSAYLDVYDGAVLNGAARRCED